MTTARLIPAAWRELLADTRVAELAAAARGAPTHLVGGAVRDAGLGRPVNDLDVVVAEGGPEIARRLADTTGSRLVELGGDRFGAIRLVSGSRHIDLWDLRGGALSTDLWRRDFTVNAIALQVPEGVVTDPTGGLEDLARRRLRATREGVFAEDPVRVLRLARLVTTLPGFTADTATAGWARAVTPRLGEMPHERLRVELELLFGQPQVAPAAGWCDDLDLPKLFFGKGAALADASSTTLGAAKKLDEWRALRLATAPATSRASISAANSPQALHWSLFSELFSSSHEETSSRLRDLVRRGLMTRDCSDAALALLAPQWQAPQDEPGRRRWLHHAGARWRDSLALRAVLTGSAAELEAWASLETTYLGWPEALRSAVLSPPALMTGADVQALLGIAPGPAVGAALARVRRAQVEGVVRMREEAEALLRSAPAAD